MKRERFQDDLIFCAWHVASLGRAKDIPKLSTLLKRRKNEPVKRKTSAELLKKITAINALLGGIDKREEA